jgi:hypothetical protein
MAYRAATQAITASIYTKLRPSPAVAAARA